jgi:peroxiredoxin Q/BCP
MISLPSRIGAEVLAWLNKEISMRLYSAAALALTACAGLFGQQPGDPAPLKVGDVAPNFTLTGTNPVVLAFFPAAFTGGWTKEFTAYQAGIAKFDGKETKVFGISSDNSPSLKVFSDQLKLSFPLLSDFKDRSTVKAYGLLRPDGMANRATYVVDMEGKIAYVEIGNTAIDPTAADEACSRLAHRAAEPPK